MADCKPCDAGNLFQIIPPPGVPQGRYVVPLVRVNAQTQDMKPGMVIDPAFLPAGANGETDFSGLVSYIEGLDGEDKSALAGALSELLGLD